LGIDQLGQSLFEAERGCSGLTELLLQGLRVICKIKMSSYFLSNF
jgi:hypothetical protein